MSVTVASVLKLVVGLTESVAVKLPAKLISTKLLEKFQKDLTGVLTTLVWNEFKSFKSEFPAVADALSQSEMQPAIQRHFGDFTADQIADPLARPALQILFMNFFLQEKWRRAEDFEALDPKYRTALDECVTHFQKQFAPKFKAALERNSFAFTELVINSLAQSGKNDHDIKTLLWEIKAAGLDLPTQLTQTIESQLLPVIRQQIELEMNRFRDWDFTYRFLRGQTDENEAEQKEWLEVLNQVLEWKDFKDIQRTPMPGVPGELFTMVKEDEVGLATDWVFWGCPTETCPDEQPVRLALTHLSQRKQAAPLLVSRNPLSAALVALADEFNIRRHLTLEEFLHTTLNITRHRQVLLEDYEKQPIFHNFIDLQCHQREKASEALDLRTQFQEWLQNDSTSHISLLGNFGTGKTVFCQRMQYELLKAYRPGQRIPVLITLREQKGVRLEQMLSTIMNQMGLKHLDYPAFRTLNRLGKFVVLIDGFDEMATYATLNEMRENFLALAVLAEGKAKVLLTCRTHYFEHARKEDEVLSLPDFIAERPEFQVLYLNPFTREQIAAYLDRMKVLYQDQQKMLMQMDQMPRLRELMEIPVLLDLILKVFPQLMDYEEKKEDITLASVYTETVKTGWLWKKRRSI